MGDLVVGYKHVLAEQPATGSILSLSGESILPTGQRGPRHGQGRHRLRGLCQLRPASAERRFLQFQSGIEVPTHTDNANRAVFWRTVLGKSFAPDKGLGRLWSPMVELLADRELASGERINWDVVPQFQVTLSRRQHIRANVGVRLPVNNYRPAAHTGSVLSAVGLVRRRPARWVEMRC